MFPFDHIIAIDKESKVSVYKQIASAIIYAIGTGTLKAGTHLPGSRELAKSLGVHRKTVGAAYEELNAQDWVTILPRKHVSVSGAIIPTLKAKRWNDPDIGNSFGIKFGLPFQVIDADLKKANKDCAQRAVIDDGHPDRRLSPIDELLKNYRSFTSRKSIVKYTHTIDEKGTLLLRKELVKYLSLTRGMNIDEDNLLITHGAQMSIYLASCLLLKAGTNIVVGKPNYPAANKTFIESGANLIEVSVDKNGIQTDQVEALCKTNKITAVYVIPHHHYPTTAVLSIERRMKLLELSKQYEFAIIEDDYDYDYHYTSSAFLPLASANHSGNVIYVGSFSNILDRSFRIGFMVAPKNFIEQSCSLRKLIDRAGDSYMQDALAILIRDGELNRHLKKTKKIYHQRRNFVDSLLKEKLSEYVIYTLAPGGMSIWIKLKYSYKIDRLAAHPLLDILQFDIEENAFRFGFASMNEQELVILVELLESIFINF